MKRALITVAVGGLLAFLVPAAASGGTARPVAPYDHSADHKAADCPEHSEGADEACPGQTEGANESEQAPPQQRNGDKEQEHSDGSEILF